MKGLFGGLFDFNHDGKLDPFERAMEFAFLDEMISEEEKIDYEMAGFDADELEYMDPDERWEALEEPGFDPEDYDFL